MATSRGARHRKFYSLPAGEELGGEEGGAGGGEQLAEYISDNIIGAETTFLSPFGRRRVVYCDYTASGRSLAFIEQFITEEVLPMYGNTHTTTSVTSLQTTLYRHEARDIVRSACGAGEQDAVIFTGSGCTGAVQCLVSALGLGQEEQVTVLVGPLEHHSNLLPWRESGARVVAIRPDPTTGRTDLGHLAQELARLQHQGTVIGCFSAASNVTGLMEDDLAVTALLHTYGALAFWDYAAAAPYVSIQMNPKVPEDRDGRCYKDAIYFSTHKFVGGVQTPGVLVAKKSLFRNTVPNSPGGGTVFYVTESDHRYLQEPEVREEGGTPAIVESVRAGLVLKLKAAAGPEQIMALEEELRSEALAAWGHLDNLVLLGPGHGPALPIFSFLVRHPATGLFLHHNYVVALLNDLFGIQARGGCACAGPYMQRLLGLDLALVRRFEAVLVEDSRLDRVGLRRGHMEHGQWEVLRPGATRLNIPWFAPREEVDFILKAVKMVAEEGWKLLPLYRFNNETGEWRHSSNSVFKDRRWLGHVTFTAGRMQFAPPSLADQGAPPESLDMVLAAGRATIDTAARLAARETVPDQTAAFPPEAAALRWFLTPSEAAACLLPSLTPSPALQPPFSPPKHHAPVPQATPRIGSLFGPLQLQPATSSLLSSSLARGTVRQSVRRARTTPSAAPALPTSHSVTVNGATSVTVIAGSGEGGTEGVTVNGFKSVISVSSGDISEESAENNFATGEAGQITFDDDEETGSDPAPPAISDAASKTSYESDPAASSNDAPAGGGVVPPAASSDDVPAASSDDVPAGGGVVPPAAASACDSGVCLLPEGGRTSPAPCLASAQWRVPSKEVFRSFLEAVTEFSMVRDGDRLLVCLSGGKDSLSLLHCVRQYQFMAKKQGINFEFGAVTVDPMSSGYDPRPLVPYLRQLGVPYLYEQQDIMAQALESQCSSICSFCSRMKRGRIYAAARREGYNVLAMGQHLDDLAESFLMSVFHNGRLRTMKAAYSNREGDLRVIRPLVYTRERSLRNFAESSGLPVIAENCPACFEAPKERQRMKQLLAQQELLFPRLYWNLKAALYPVMRIDRTGLESLVFGKGKQEEEEDEDDI